MSKCVNDITLIGNMGKAPERRETKGGAVLAEFPMATSRKWTTAAGEDKEATQWHRCVAWNSPNDQTADLALRLGRKGAQIYVKGRLEYRNYQDREGKEVWVTEVIVSDFIILDRAPSAVAG